MSPRQATQIGVLSMDRSDVIKLLCTAFVADEYGVERKTTTEREVFCQVNSITRQEFFEAGRNGLNPELMFSVFVDDYNGEPLLEYRGKVYAIYRTYLGRNDRLELYAERKGGTNGTEDTY